MQQFAPNFLVWYLWECYSTYISDSAMSLKYWIRCTRA